MMYEYIEEGLKTSIGLTLRELSEILTVTRSGYYKWKANEQEVSVPKEMRLRDRMQRLAIEFPGYGYRRITKQLVREGFVVNHKKVLRLMREDNLLCIRKKSFVITTDSKHSFPIYPNLAKDMVLTDINQLWVCDITYIRLMEEFVYLAVIIDVFSRKCIGWELDRYIDTQLTLNALKKALETRSNEEILGLVHHSDRGVQYASYAYTDCLREHKIEISMSAKGNPYDNAFAESFMKTLKYEEVYLSEYTSFSDAYERIANFIEDVYNEKRLHSSIGYLTPNEFEMELINPPR